MVTQTIQVHNPTSAGGAIVQTQTAGDKQKEIDNYWWRLFDVPGAARALDTHLANLGSDRHEGHTRKAYESSLRRFLNWAGPQLPQKELRRVDVYTFAELHPSPRFPGPQMVAEYIADMKRRGLKKSTIDRHMAPVRIYLRALRKQYIPVKADGRHLVEDCKQFMEQALDEKVKATETTGNSPALYQYGTRLSVAQVDAIFTRLLNQDDDDMAAARDLALLYLGFNAGLRDAELRRLTLSDITQGANSLEIRVRGKRNNYAPVPLDETGHALIMRWVDLYNDGLDEDDPRRIAEDVPIFQPVQKGNNRRTMGVNSFDPTRGLGRSSLRYIVKKRTGETSGVPEITPHDMRRTAAFIGRLNGMGYDDLQALLRHKSIETTRRYVGNPPDLRKSLISSKVTWSVRLAS